MTKYATVDQLIVILQQLSAEGCGDAEVTCNQEYAISLPTYEEEDPLKGTYKGGRFVDFGGYC